MWYHEGTIKPSSLKSFIIRAEKDLNFRTKITNQSEIGRNEFVWYDIIDEKDKEVASRTRFTYIGDVVNGLNQFEETLRFCLKPKSETPIRKQKRNDNQ